MDLKKAQKEALQRLADARRQKQQRDRDIREGYFFVAPQRCRDIMSINVPQLTQPNDQSDLQTSMGIECAEDFVNEVLEGFMPESMDWCAQQVPTDASDDERADIEEQVTAQTATVHAAMRESNFYPELAQACVPDLPIGTVAVWIDKLRLSDPIQVRAVPLKELDINVGPDGKVDDRFVTRHTKMRHVPAMLREDILPPGFMKRIETEGDKACRVTWGFWRDWSAPGVVWNAVTMLDEKALEHTTLIGEGSCPLLVARFDPDPAFPFGEGVALKALPELRRLDEMDGLEVESYDFRVHPPFVYPHDGNINFANGIEPGMGYPMQMGPGQEPKSLLFDADVNFAEYVRQRVEMRIKRLFYVDYPEQRGKTPPTAEQWLSEMAMRQRRLGRPGKVFWSEGPREYFLRFRHLLEKAGRIEPIRVNGREMPLTPYNPTEKAKETQEVAVANQLLQIATSAFPQVAQVQIDQEATLNNLKAKMRDEIVVIRSAKEVAKAAQDLAPVFGAGGPGGAPSPDALGGLI